MAQNKNKKSVTSTKNQAAPDISVWVVRLTLACACALCSLPMILVKGFIHAHDFAFHVSRAMSLRDGILTGEFLPKIYSEFYDGYGYASGLFYPDVFLYIPALLNLAGMNMITAFKIFFGLCILCTALSMYFCCHKITGNRLSSLCAAVLYVTSTYFTADIFVRAAVGEILSFIFLPFIIPGLYGIIYNDYRKYWRHMAAGITGIALSHVITLQFTVIIIFIICLFYVKRFINEPKRLLYMAVAAAAVLLLTGFLYVPMVEQLLAEDISFSRVGDGSGLFLSAMPPGLIYSGLPHPPDALPWFPPGIGFAFILANLLWFMVKRQPAELYRFMNVLLVAGIAALFCATNIFPWNHTGKIFVSIQFPWRLLLFSTMFLSVSGGIMFCMYDRNKLKLFYVLPAAGVIAVMLFAVNVHDIYSYKKDRQEIVQKAWWGYFPAGEEYLPAGMDSGDLKKRKNTILSNNHVNTVNLARKGGRLNFTFSDNLHENTWLELPLIYYKGYRAELINGNKRVNLPVDKSENKLVRVKLGDARQGEIKVSYAGTRLAFFFGALSFLTWIGILARIVIIYIRKPNRGGTVFSAH